jgi:hypothetical protein
LWSPKGAHSPLSRPEGRADQWPRALTQQQIADICSVHAPIMQRFGYLLPDCGRAVQRASKRVLAGGA